MNTLLKKTSLAFAFIAFTTCSYADETPVCAGADVKPVIHKRVTTSNASQKRAATRAPAARVKVAAKNFFTPKAAAASVYPGQVLKSEGKVLLVERDGVALSKPVQLSTGFSVRLQDVIQTSGQSFISIELGDGVQMVLPSNSRIQLTQVNKRLARIKLLSGRIENRVPKQPNAKTNVFEIQTPAVVLGVRGTFFRAEYDETKHLTTANVLDGIIAVNKAEQCAAPLILNQGQGVSLQNNVPEQATNLLNAPTFVEKNKDAQINQQVLVKLNPVEGAVKYHAELSRDNAFLDKYREAYGASTELAFENVPSGFYFVRATAIDAAGIEGQYEEHFFLRNYTERQDDDVLAFTDSK